jgi:rhodanese-related sulfurtransferase
LRKRYSDAQRDDVCASYASAPTGEIVFHSDDVQPSVLSTDLPAGVFLLDVREDDEWVAGHAPDAVHIPVGAIAGRVAEIPQDREIYVICRSGARSAYASQALAGAGRTTINVADGMTGWAVAGRPMVSESGAEPYVA